MLGDPKAPLTVTEFLDLQCPICARGVEDHAADAGPRLRPHRQGEAARRARCTSSAPDSSRAARVAAGAQQQGKLWPFLEAFYAAQGAGELRLRDRRASCARSPRPPASTPAKALATPTPPRRGRLNAGADADAHGSASTRRRRSPSRAATARRSVIAARRARRARSRRALEQGSSRDEPARRVDRSSRRSGSAIAAYLTVVHYTGGEPVCAIAHGCATVQQSALRGARRGARSRCSALLGYVAHPGRARPRRRARRTRDGVPARSRASGSAPG